MERGTSPTPGRSPRSGRTATPELDTRLQTFREGPGRPLRGCPRPPDRLALRDLVEQYGIYAQEFSAEADRLRELTTSVAQPGSDESTP